MKRTTRTRTERGGFRAVAQRLRGAGTDVIGRALAAALPAFVLLLVAAVPAPAARAADARFALVIGQNVAADDPGLDPLRYADDDAVRYADLLGAVSERVILLTTLDAETSRLLGARAYQTTAPTRAAVLAAVGELRRDMAAAKARGDRPVLYFVFSGHGSYDDEGRGYVFLADGRFTTRDLFHEVLGPTRDDPVILIVDACNASLLVNTRGAGDERRPTRPTTLRLEDYPNVGVVLSSSTIGESHEWGRYLAGIFSHEVRSALVGAADIDDDAQVGFGELAAFIAAANARVTNPTVRIRPYIRPPLTDPNLPLIDLRGGRFAARVRVDARLAGKTHVLDGDLVRYADFHATFEAREGFWLALTRPGEYVIVHDEREWVVPADARGDLALDALPTRPRSVVSARGAGSEYFERTLFQEPYGRVFAHRYLSDDYEADLAVQHAALAPWYDNPTAWSLLGGGIAAGIGGLVLHVRAFDLRDDASHAALAVDRARLNDDLESYQTGATILYGIGAAAVVTSVVLFALDRPVEVETYHPPLRVELTGTGVRIQSDW
ncbi:MAG: caspase family protein [Myxococcales bacterium]|nr:caspase family protein [Myxococcales bacterium]MCB9732068.1 caspase family protein [Deltaproteobacteria bacterium]